MPFIVPPGGLAGFNQMAPASKRALFSPGRSSGARTRKRRTKSPKARTRKSRSGGGRKMKFGSPAWQKKYKVGKFRK